MDAIDLEMTVLDCLEDRTREISLSVNNLADFGVKKSTDYDKQYDVKLSLLEEGNMDKGYIHFFYDPSSRLVGVLGILVNPIFEGTGLGRLLMGIVERVAKKSDCVAVRTYDIDFAGFWEHMGYIQKPHSPDNKIALESPYFFEKRLD